jgi:parallel beta-helix repeat protein
MNKKLIGFFVCILFFGVSFTPNILGLQLNFKSNNESGNRDISYVDSDYDFKVDTPNLLSVSIIQKMYTLQMAIISPPMYVYVALDAPGFYDWDVNMDWVIDIIDLTLVSNAYNSTGPPGWIREDVNDDGIVDINDLIIVMNHYGETYTPLYDNIQDGIDAVAENGTVYVYNGTYYETVIVNKTVNLTGEDKNTTIIDSNGLPDGLYVTSDNFTLSNFTIKNGYQDGIVIRSSINCEIKNCIISNFSYQGIVLYSYYDGETNNNSIIKCEIINNGKNGISVYGRFDEIRYNKIIDSKISFNNQNGINFDGDFQKCNNTISGNDISNNYDDGIRLVSSSENNVFSNNIYNNRWEGIDLQNSANSNNFYNNQIFENQGNGIRLYESNFNNILNNTISNHITTPSFNGIIIHFSSNNNIIYYNNFINNTQNAYDECNNIWNNVYPGGGNYWEDYIGYDDDGDGIGETPYNISGGDNQDLYPLMKPFGENPPVANFYFFYETPLVTFHSTAYDRDGEIISYEWDFGDGTTGTGKIVYHKYCEVGTYNVTLKVTDNDGLTGNITYSAIITMGNTPPEVEIYGPSQGKPGIEYEYVFNVTDPDGDEFWLWVDWGDGDSSGWLGPYFPDPSIEIKLNNSWNKTGTYTIKAKIKDFCGESSWIEFTVTIPRDKIATNNILFWEFLERFPISERLLSSKSERHFLHIFKPTFKIRVISFVQNP